MKYRIEYNLLCRRYARTPVVVLAQTVNSPIQEADEGSYTCGPPGSSRMQSAVDVKERC